MEVIKNNEEAVEKASNNEVTKEMVDNVKSEYEALKAENKTKVYGIEVKTEANLDNLIEFFDKDVEWEGTQCIGVPRIYDALKKEKIKDGHIYLPGMEVEALAFFLSKAKGKGRERAMMFADLNKAIGMSYELRAQDNKREDLLEKKLDGLMMAYEHGLQMAKAEAETEATGNENE